MPAERWEKPRLSSSQEAGSLLLFLFGLCVWGRILGVFLPDCISCCLCCWIIRDRFTTAGHKGNGRNHQRCGKKGWYKFFHLFLTQVEQGGIYWDRFIPVQSINDRFTLCIKEITLAQQFHIWWEDFPGPTPLARRHGSLRPQCSGVSTSAIIRNFRVYNHPGFEKQKPQGGQRPDT